MQADLGDTADGGQGFAAEAKGVDVAEIPDLVQFAGGVAGEGQGQIVGVDATAVIDDLDEVAAAVPHFDVEACAASINGVLQQFFDDAGGSFDDLAGGDLINERVRQRLNACHRLSRRRRNPLEKVMGYHLPYKC